MAGPYGLNADQLQSFRNIHSKAAEITICTIVIKCLCDENSCDLFMYFPTGNGMYILFTIDHDDTFFHGMEEIFYAKVTSIMLSQIVGRQQNMSIEIKRNILCTYRHTMFKTMISCSNFDCKVELYQHPLWNL